MYEIQLAKRCIKFISNLPVKHQAQIKKKILELIINPLPSDSLELIGYKPYRRLDIGEYRIIYNLDEQEKIIFVRLIGRRNDGDVYNKFKRIV